MGAPRKFTSTDVLEHLESQYDDGDLLCWAELSADLGYANASPVRRHVRRVAGVDTKAKTVTLPSGKVLRLQVPGGNKGRRGKRRNPAAAKVQPQAIAAMKAAREARSAERSRVVLAHLESLAERRAVLDTEAMGELLGVGRRAANDALHRVPGVTVTADRVVLPDGREVVRPTPGRLASGPKQRDRLAEGRRAARDAKRERVAAAVTAYLERCLASGAPASLEALQEPTGCTTPEGARQAVQRLPGFEVDRAGIGLPDGRRVPRRAPDFNPTRKKAQTNKTRARAASVGAGASRPSPKPVSLPSSPAPRASSLRTTVEAGALTPLPRASAGSSNVVTLEAKAPRVPLPRDVFPPAGGCVWPHGDVGDEGFHFCGAESLPGRPYCRRHHARAYRPRVTAEAAE